MNEWIQNETIGHCLFDFQSNSTKNNPFAIFFNNTRLLPPGYKRYLLKIPRIGYYLALFLFINLIFFSRKKNFVPFYRLWWWWWLCLFINWTMMAMAAVTWMKKKKNFKSTNYWLIIVHHSSSYQYEKKRMKSTSE